MAAAEQVVTELTIDGRGAETGSALYIRAMQAAQSAVDRVIDRNRALEQTITSGNVVMLSSANSIASTARAWERFKASADPAMEVTQKVEKATLLADRAVKLLGVDASEAASLVEIFRSRLDGTAQASAQAAARLDTLRQKFDPAYVSAQRLNSELADLAELERAGVQITGGYSAALDDLVLKYDATARAAAAAKTSNDAFIAQARADQEAANASQIAAANQNRYNGVFGIGRQMSSASDSASAFEDQFNRDAAAAARLRAELDPVVAAQDRLNAELAEYAALAHRGAISAEELARAQTLARTRGAGPGARAGHAAGFVAGQQLQDIAMMAALGQSPLTMAFQQGPQLATAIEQGGGLAALRSGLASLISPTMGITIALTAAAGAAIQFSTAIFNRGKSIDDVLKGHKALIDEITKSFPEAAAAAKQYEDQAKLLPRSVIGADTAQQAKDEAEAYQKAMQDFRIRFNLMIQGDTGQGDFAGVGKAGVRAFAEISQGIKTGQIDAIELQRRLGELRLNPDLTKNARDLYKVLQDAVNPAAELERHMQGTAAAVHGIAGGFNGPGGLPIYLDPNAGAYDRSKALSDQQTQRARMRRSFTAEIAGISARSPLDRAGAARLQAEAQVNKGETPEERKLRIDHAGQRALIEAQHQLTEAQDQRARSYQQVLKSQELDVSLIGKATGEATAQREAFQMLSAIRQEAAQNGITKEAEFQKYYGAEIEKVKQLAQWLGRVAEARARAQLGNDLSFDLAQLGRSPIDQQVAATEKQYGLPIDLNSADAATIRYALNVKKVGAAWQDVRDVGMNAIDQLTGSASKGFKNIGDVVNSVAGDIERQLLQLAIANPLKNAIYDAGLPTLGEMGGLGGIFSALTGGQFKPGSIPGLQATSAMNVQAAVVNINGAGAAGIAGGVSRLFAPGNDNYASDAVTRMPLGPIGSTGSRYNVNDATSFIRQYASAIGIDPDTAVKVARGEGLGSGIWQSNVYRNGIREPSFGPYQLLKGGPGTGFGTGLGNRFMSQTGLDPADPANWQRSTAFALDQAKANGWGDWFGAKAQGITGFMGIDRGASNAVGALDKLTGTAGQAAQGLGAFGSGLTNFGNALSQVPASSAAGGGGGIFGWLGRLFGGGGASNLFPAAPAGPIATGMSLADWGFANGTPGAPPGWAWVGERGPELMRFRGGEQVMPSPMSFAVARGFAGGTPGMEAGQPRPIAITIENHGTPQQVVDQREESDGRGGRRTVLVLSDMVSDAISTPGRSANRALKGMGVGRRLKQR